MKKIKNKYVIIGIVSAFVIALVIFLIATSGKSDTKKTNAEPSSVKTSTVKNKPTTTINKETTTAEPITTASTVITTAAKTTAVSTTTAKATAMSTTAQPSVSLNLICKNSIPFTASDYFHRGSTFTITDVHLANVEVYDDHKGFMYNCYITATRGYDGLGGYSSVYLNINLYDAAGNFIDNHGTYAVGCLEGETQTKHPDGALSSERILESGTYYYELVPEIRAY